MTGPDQRAVIRPGHKCGNTFAEAERGSVQVKTNEQEPSLKRVDAAFDVDVASLNRAGQWTPPEGILYGGEPRRDPPTLKTPWAAPGYSYKGAMFGLPAHHRLDGAEKCATIPLG
jgi:hypothetical protein